MILCCAWAGPVPRAGGAAAPDEAGGGTGAQKKIEHLDMYRSHIGSRRSQNKKIDHTSQNKKIDHT